MASKLTHKTKITPVERLTTMYRTLLEYQTTSKILKSNTDVEYQTRSKILNSNTEIDRQSIIVSKIPDQYLSQRKTYVSNRMDLEVAVLTVSRKSTDLKLNAQKIKNEIKSRLELIEKVQTNARNFIQLPKRATLTLNLLE